VTVNHLVEQPVQYKLVGFGSRGQVGLPRTATFPPALTCIQEYDHIREGDAVWFPRPFVGRGRR
jgi:hypothetical protein